MSNPITVATDVAALFPYGISELFNWKGMAFDGTLWEINKTVVMSLVSTVICLALFVVGGRKQALVPTGMQNVAEVSYEFVDKGIATEVMGHDGHKWTPFLGAMFFWLFFINIWSTVPFVMYPATSRIAIPLVLCMVSYFTFIGVGFYKQGPLYILKAIFPPGVPKAIAPLVAAIELVSKFAVRPFSLAVRLFANMFAGHILLALFALMTAALVEMNSGAYQGFLAIFPFLGLIFMVAFELLVAFLQAYIFTTLTAVYIAEAASEEH